MCTLQKLTCFGSATNCNGPHSQKSGCGRLRQVKAGVEARQVWGARQVLETVTSIGEATAPHSCAMEPCLGERTVVASRPDLSEYH